jgi:hypothetical protein
MSEMPPSATTPVVLVGDRFEFFIAAGLGMSAAGFAEAVGRGSWDGLTEPIQIHLGQGLNEAAVATVGEALERRGLSDRLLLDPRDLPTPVPPGAVHKRDARNVLLADFEYDGADTFEASLRLHNDNELVLDHQSGPHLQGMILIEAARQLFVAVCELEYLRPWPDRRFSFLLAQVDTRFDRPVFPLPLRMRMTAHRAETADVNRLRFDLETRFVQGGREAATSTVIASVSPLERFRPAELRTAAAAIAALPACQPLTGR